MYVVTGGAGFIGSNIVKGLNDRGITDILVVDDLTDGTKFRNIVSCQMLDYCDKQDFLNRIKTDPQFSHSIQAILHQGACSATTEWNGQYMMQNNYEYSKQLLHHCLATGTQFIYASSAAVYGLTDTFVESPEYEAPLNVYGYSKLQFDRYVRRFMPTSTGQIVGLRYFNVFGPGEWHKGSMASVMFHFYNQLRATGIMKLFAGNNGYANGEQRRDFIHISDIVKVNLWFLENRDKSGIFNVGTGNSRSFNDVAKAIIDYHKAGTIEYVSFPAHLKGFYQSFTEADIGLLRSIGYPHEFCSLEQGIRQYLAEFRD